ncbi:uncharacterized protein LOC125077827 [Vanessa atalanta]|uniref:uncharacterized protein LOC125077827 n=1 Tax=Vanessa atalanta TaxID=42275 RepID=UPI001FCDE751|nr:uncharacterized protein LOC125077827 [Vanessa atalanta]
MKIRVGLLFLFLTCAKTTEDVYNRANSDANLDNVYRYWPSSRYNAKVMQFRKREADSLPKQINDNPDTKSSTVNIDAAQHVDGSNTQPQNDVPNKEIAANNEGIPPHDGLSEGGIGKLNVNPLPPSPAQADTKIQSNSSVLDSPKGNITKLNETLVKTNATVANKTTAVTSTEAESSLDLNNPGVVKRGLIVFGGFSLLAVAYFIFYRKKNQKYDSGNAHNTNDANQFRYGVLQSDDRRDNLELSRIPLTMESDEDEDEDLEIFDLEQKKKSLSYVNLQTNDEDIVLHSSKDESKNNLLLDIEDGPSDTLINWSSNGNKSIL